MENQSMDPKKTRHRKLMVIIPVLVLPFITLMFMALGGGKSALAETGTSARQGFNLSLPDANIQEKTMGKMDYYNQAHADSLKFLEQIKNDPSYRQQSQLDFQVQTGLNTSVYGTGGNDPNSDKIFQRLAQINGELNRPVGSSFGSGYGGASYRSAQVHSVEVDRLEKMMQMMNQPAAEDQEMKQLSGMLDKIMEIQNPELASQRLKESSAAQRGKVFPVTTQPLSTGITSIDDNKSSAAKNGFYSLDGAATDSYQNAIQAVIHETQEVVTGSTIKLRLTNAIYINGICIPKDNFLFGTASLDGERLVIGINGIRFNNSLFPVELKVYDMDGLDGLYIPGAITRDVAKQSADRSMQNIGITSLDPSWGAQAASAGIEAAKSLFGKKVKLIKVTVKSGYRVLLKDEKQKENR